MALIGPLSASAGNSVIQVSGSIEILNGHTIAIEGGGDPGLYAAGDGLILSSSTFSTDLKSDGGLKIDAAELAIEVNDFAGTGLEDDGSDNLRIAAAAAGNGLTGGAGSALAVGAGIGINVTSTTVSADNTVVATLSGSQFSGNVGVTGSLGVTAGLSGSLTTLTDGRPLLLPGNADVTIASGSGDQITITVNNTTYTAGDGLDLSGTSFSTDLKSSGGLKIDTTELAVEPSDFAGTGLEDDGSDNLRIAASAAGTGLSGGAGSALSIDNSVVATISGSNFIGAVIARAGLSGSITTLDDGRPLMLPGNANISITSGSGDQILISSTYTNTTYTAGDGLDLSGTVFATDLKAGSGLVIDSTELSIDHTIIPTTSGAIFSGDVGITGSLSTTGHAEVLALEVGGGYGSSGVTITGAGAINLNSSIKVGGGAIQDSAGNNNILISGGNTTISGDLTAATGIKISSNAITASDGGKPIIWDTSDNVTIAGDLTVTGNDIKDSGGNIAIAFDGSGNIVNDVTFKSIAGGTTFPTISLESTDLSANDSAELRFKKYDTAIADNSFMGEIYFMAGEVEGSYYSAAAINATADGNWIDGSSRPGKLNFFTSGENSTSLISRLSINEHGDVDIVKNLYAAGNISASGSIDAVDDITIGSATDYFKIAVTANGETTFTTVDPDGAAGNINFEPDGSFNVAVPNTWTLDAAGFTGYMKYSGTTAIEYNLDAAPIITMTGNSTLKGTGNLAMDANGGLLYFQTGGSTRMTVNAVGDVAIGDSTPDYRFEVNAGTNTSYISRFTSTSVEDNPDGLRIDIAGASDAYSGYLLYLSARASSALKVGTWVSDGDGTSTIGYTFTGTHDCALELNETAVPGMIVESTGDIWVKNTDTTQNVFSYHTALPYTRLAPTNGSKTVFGVLDIDMRKYLVEGEHAGEGKIPNPNWKGIAEGTFPGLVENNPLKEGYSSAQVMSLGEGTVWVTNINGNIENGDLIESSVASGYGRLQDDDIMRSKTVAKCTQNIDWDSVIDTVDHDGQTYKKYLAACTFHCG